jgi:glutathione S-transferase
LPDATGNLSQQEKDMITIHGVPLSVHTRKAIVTAILKDIDYKFEVVIPVIPDNPPPNWRALSPTGLIPAMQDGDFTLADSTAICLYMEKKQPAPAVLPGEGKAYGRALWFDAYAGGTIFRHVVHPLFHQTIVAPNIRKVPSDRAVIDQVLNAVQPEIFGYLESEIDGKFLIGNAMTLADIAIASNFIIYQYIGYKIDAARYPKLAKYVRGVADNAAFRKALDDEKPFVANMGLDRTFLD